MSDLVILAASSQSSYTTAFIFRRFKKIENAEVAVACSNTYAAPNSECAGIYNPQNQAE